MAEKESLEDINKELVNLVRQRRLCIFQLLIGRMSLAYIVCLGCAGGLPNGGGFRSIEMHD